MKTYSLALFVLAGATSLVHAQIYNFTTTLHERTERDLAMTGSLWFTPDGDVVAELFNVSDKPAYVTGVYFLRPEGLTATSLELAPNSTWENATGLSNSHGGGLPINTQFSSYFGATVPMAGPGGPSKGGFGSAPNPGNMETFMWSGLAGFNPALVDWDAYAASTSPHVVIRWQSVGDDQKDSAKGYAFVNFQIPPDVTPVPEPQTIALFGMAGLFGILFVRGKVRRMRAKA